MTPAEISKLSPMHAPKDGDFDEDDSDDEEPLLDSPFKTPPASALVQRTGHAAGSPPQAPRSLPGSPAGPSSAAKGVQAALGLSKGRLVGLPCPALDTPSKAPAQHEQLQPSLTNLNEARPALEAAVGTAEAQKLAGRGLCTALARSQQAKRCESAGWSHHSSDSEQEGTAAGGPLQAEADIESQPTQAGLETPSQRSRGPHISAGILCHNSPADDSSMAEKEKVKEVKEACNELCTDP